MFFQISISDGLSWPSISFIVLIVAMIMISFILWRRYRSRQFLMQRISELEALRTAGRAIVESQQDIEALCALIAYESGMIIDNRTFQVGVFQGSKYHIVYWQINGVHEPSHTFDLSENKGLVGWVRDTKEPLLIYDFEKELDTLPVSPRYVSDTPPRSAIFLPLLSGDTAVGVIAAQHHEPNRFNEDDMRRLTIIANQSGAAISNAKLFTQIEERAWLTTAQLQIAQIISQNSDLESMISATTRLTSMLVGVSFCAVLVWREEFEHYAWLAGFAEHHDELDSKMAPFSLQIGEWSALDAVHVGQTAIETQHLPYWIRPFLPNNQQNITLHPLTVSSEQVGILIIDPPKENNENSTKAERQHELLQNITSQIGQAINNANLRLAQQEEAWVNTALLQVAEAVNNLIDLQEILGTIVRLVPMLVGVETALILIWDANTETFKVGPNFGMSEMGVGILETLALDRNELNDLATLVIEADTLLPHFRIDVQDWLEKSLASKEAFAFPLRARGHLVGVLVIGTNEQAFSNRRLNILNGIAQQAATAVVNNQLYLESAERSRLEQELDLAREIQGSLIPAGNPQIPGCTVASYWEAARQVSGDFYDFLQLSDEKWGIIVADVADKGVPAALFMALSRTIIRAVAFTRSNPADTLIRANQIIDKDAQSDLFVTVFYAIWDSNKEEIVFANGGHNPPILIRENGEHTLLKSKGIALGVLPDIQIDCQKIKFNKGDVLVFYTDGVTEAMNEDFDEFDLHRLIITANNARNNDAEYISQSIQTAVKEHVGATAQSDDVTLVVIKRNP